MRDAPAPVAVLDRASAGAHTTTVARPHNADVATRWRRATHGLFPACVGRRHRRPDVQRRDSLASFLEMAPSPPSGRRTDRLARCSFGSAPRSLDSSGQSHQAKNAELASGLRHPLGHDVDLPVIVLSAQNGEAWRLPSRSH
jgi:hypothetical protein